MSKVLDVIKNRRSTRSYKEEQVSEEEIMALLEAGALAPSGLNMQPWHFTVVQNKELIEKINDRSKYAAKDVENEKMRNLANNPAFNIFHGAPTIIVVSYKENTISSVEGISAASENILLQAESMGPGTCWSGFVTGIFKDLEKEVSIKDLDIPKGYTPSHALAIGYPKVKVVNGPKRKENYFNFKK